MIFGLMLLCPTQRVVFMEAFLKIILTLYLSVEHSLCLPLNLDMVIPEPRPKIN